MSNNIKIGTTPLKDLNAQNLIDIALIEGVVRHQVVWGNLEVLDFSNTLFSDTLVIDFTQTRIRDRFVGDPIVMFFDFKALSFHYHFKNAPDNSRPGRRIRIDTIRYLIKNGFDVPIY